MPIKRAFAKKLPTPGIEPGPPGWKPGILTTRPLWDLHICQYTCNRFEKTWFIFMTCFLFFQSIQACPRMPSLMLSFPHFPFCFLLCWRHVNEKNSDQEVDVYFIYSPIPFLLLETNVQTSDFRHFLPRIVEKAWPYTSLVYAPVKERGVKKERTRKRIIF